MLASGLDEPLVTARAAATLLATCVMPKNSKRLGIDHNTDKLLQIVASALPAGLGTTYDRIHYLLGLGSPNATDPELNEHRATRRLRARATQRFRGYRRVTGAPEPDAAGDGAVPPLTPREYYWRLGYLLGRVKSKEENVLRSQTLRKLLIRTQPITPAATQTLLARVLIIKLRLWIAQADRNELFYLYPSDRLLIRHTIAMATEEPQIPPAARGLAFLAGFFPKMGPNAEPEAEADPEEEPDSDPEEGNEDNE
jgi:hypothetical protein